MTLENAGESERNMQVQNAKMKKKMLKEKRKKKKRVEHYKRMLY